jgi:hypothetical protein
VDIDQYLGWILGNVSDCENLRPLFLDAVCRAHREIVDEVDKLAVNIGAYARVFLAIGFVALRQGGKPLNPPPALLPVGSPASLP